MITFEEVKKDRAIRAYIEKANDSLRALGFTEHGFPHVMKVAKTASDILLTLGYSEREAELSLSADTLQRQGAPHNVREGQKTRQ